MVSVIVKHPSIYVDGAILELGSKVDVEEALAKDWVSRGLAELAPTLEVATPTKTRRKSKAK